MRRLRTNVLWAIVAAAVAVSAVVAVLWLAPGGSPGPRPTEAFGVQNETSALGPVYHPGIILGAASNGSVALLGGIGVYTKVPEYTLPDLASATVASGRVVVTNIYPVTDTRPVLPLNGLAQWEKQIVGCIFGSVNSRADIPRLLGLYRDGLLDLDAMVTRTYPLEEINQGYQDLRDGKNIRGVLVM